ncbi:MAG: GAF domain-containing protein, partial [Chloroflexota bacterium]
ISIDGTPIHSTADLNRVLTQHAAGDTVAVVYEKATGSSLETPTIVGERTVSIRLIAFPRADLISIFAIPYFVGFLFLLIGLWVFYLRRHEAAGRAFALFCAATAVMIGAIFDLYTTHIFASLWTTSVCISGAGLYTLGMVFPQEAAFVTRQPLRRWAGFGLALIIAAVGVVAVNDFANPRWYAAPWLVSFVFSALGVLFFIATSIYRWRWANSPIVRKQSSSIVIGSLGFLPSVGWVVISTLWPQFKFNTMLFAPMIFFPLGIAYAIIRYRLLNAEFILGRALVYGLLGVLTAAGYWLLVSGASIITGATVPASSPFAIGAMVFILVLAFNPLRNGLQRTIDFYFFRGSQAYREQLLAFGRALTESTELPFIAGELRQQIETTLKPSHLHIFLRDANRTEYSAYAASGRADTDLRFNAEGALARALSTQRSTIYLAPDSPLPSALVRDRARIAVLGSLLFIPLNSKSGLIGWLSLGSRLSGEPYSQQDLGYLESLADQSALAIERALAVDTLEKRVNELNVLSQVSQAVNFTTGYDDLLELVYAQAGRVLDVRNFTIVLHEPRTQNLWYAFFVENDERDTLRENNPWKYGQGLASEIIRTGQPIITDDYLGECARRHVAPLNRPYHAWMGVPLNAGSGTLGAMTIAALDAGHTFTDDQLKIFAAIADQAATAIDKARLYRQTEERARQLATLNQLAQTITSTLDLETLLQRILESAVDILNCEAGSLFLVDEESNDSVLKVAVGPVARDIIGIRVPAGKGIVGSAVETGQPVIVNDTAHDPRWFQKPDQTTGFVSRAMMAVPLRVKEKSIGVVEVINKRSGAPFTDEDTALLTAFAGQAAVSIENARLFNLTDQALAARVEELSVMQRIDRELNAALDIRRVMTVILDRALIATKANAGIAGLVVPDGVQIVAHRGYGSAITSFLDTPFPADKGLVGKALATRSTLFVKDAKSQPDYFEVLSDTASQLTVPIVREDEPIGVLMLESRDADCFSDDNVTFLARLADHSVAAITNARLYAEVNAANQAKSEFVSMVSHELKNPMQSIKGYTQLMVAGTAGAVNEGQQHFLNIVQDNVERMITIVSDLTDIARIESGRLQLNLKPMEFKDMIEEVVRSMQGAYDSKQQTLIVETDARLPSVMGDYVRLVQVLTNLISNAHKYSPDGGTVTLRAQSSKNVWDSQGAPEVLHVSVQDTGYGISPEDQDKIFTKFFRADNNIGDAPGTGLGLNIVKQMVELGGGKVWFESEPGKGSTFHFTVPLAGD